MNEKMINLYIFARKTHRLLVLILTVLTLVMAGTGVVLRYISFFLKVFPSLDINLLRYVHNKLSPYFSIALVLMAISGLYMYLHVWWIKRKNRNQSPQ